MKGPTILGGITALLLAGCGGDGVVALVTTSTTSSSSTTPSRAPRPTRVPSSTPPESVSSSSSAQLATSSDPSQKMCQVQQTGGTFYLWLVSADAHDFSLCNGATPSSLNVDQLLQKPGMDRRCIIYPTNTGPYAIVGVYSDTSRGDETAALQYCRAHGGELG